MNDEQDIRSEEALRVLFEHVSRRLQPPSRDEEEIREAVHAQWSRSTRRRRRRKQFVYWALAASVMLAVFVGLRSPPDLTTPVLVATIEKSFGEIVLRKEEARDLILSHHQPTNIMTGQTIVTGVDARLSLIWFNGGSLRLDQETEVRFISPSVVELIVGRIYFDSGSTAAKRAGGSSFAVSTDIAIVRHVGTQFMIGVFDRVLTVSIREGAVSIEGSRYDGTATAGERVEIQTDGGYVIDAEPGFGNQWNWIEAIAPSMNLNGRTILEFLNWVSRESGRPLKFESASAKAIAASEELRGIVDVEPTRALEIFLQTTDLEAETADDVISIRLATAGE